MTTRKNQNSILVLATLGVYLGLVLVGTTPQVLAQAALTRQFNVKDEFEAKDDPDKKPDTSITEDKGEALLRIDDHVSNSLDKFLSNLSPSVCSARTACHVAVYREIGPSLPKYKQPAGRHIYLLTLVAVTNFPRAGLDSLLVIDAK